MMHVFLGLGLALDIVYLKDRGRLLALCVSEHHLVDGAARVQLRCTVPVAAHIVDANGVEVVDVPAPLLES